MQYSDPQHSRRRVERIALPLPVRIESKEHKDNAWDEISRFISVSRCGAGFELKHKVKVGQLVLLTAPLPQKLRSYDYSEQQYKVWGIVRYCHTNEKNPASFSVGVAFIGKYAPLSFHQNPGKTYNLTNFTQQGFGEITEAAEEYFEQETAQIIERQFPRYSIPMDIFLQALDQNSNVTAYETTVSENVSLYGASVFTSLETQNGDLVKVNFISLNVSIVAKIRNRRLGSDGITRLHLEFIDRSLPLEGIE